MGQKSPPRRRQRRKMRWKRLFVPLLVVFVIVPVAGLGWGAFRLSTEVHAAKDSYHARNYSGLGASLKGISTTLGVMGDEAHLLGWMDLLPLVRGYYLNGMDLLTAGQKDVAVVAQVVPPVLSARATQGTSAKSAAVKAAISQAGLMMSRLAPNVLAANRSIQNMNDERMPGFLEKKGLQVHGLQSLSSTLVKLLPAMTGPRPILASLLGMPSPVRYMLIFQNSGELRATGGFMTAYADVPFKNGKLGKIKSQNLQMLDQQVTYRPSPPLIISYLPVSYWHLRDANTAIANLGAAVPDVPEAASNIYQFYDSIPGAVPVNGLVFMDTWLVDDLIGDVGGLNVPTLRGKTVHLTAQNANKEMEMMAEGQALPANLRKLFIGTMMRQLMHDVFHSHLSELLKVAATFSEALSHEHIMLYLNQPKAEHFVTTAGWAGAIPKTVPGDFTEVIDENLLGHKDNYWMHESYQVNISTNPSGAHLETVTIHWKLPALSVPKPPYLVVPYHSWVTVVAPAGSSLVSMTATTSGGNGAPGGIDSYIQATTDPTINKEEFGAHLNLPVRTAASQPPAVGTVITKFWLPKGVPIHRILLQKQPGLRAEPVSVTVNGQTQHITLNRDSWVKFPG